MITEDHSAPYNAGVPNSSPGKRSVSQPLPELSDRLGYLLKHAQQRLAELTSSAMAPFGITGRECAVLIAIDGLEGKGLVRRRRDRDDRRRNVVELTGAGRTTLRRASLAGQDAERRFLS